MVRSSPWDAAQVAIYCVCSAVCGGIVVAAVIAYHTSVGMRAAAASRPTEPSMQWTAPPPSLVQTTPVPATGTQIAVVKPTSPVVKVISRAEQVIVPQDPPGDIYALPPADDRDVDEWAGYKPFKPARKGTYKTVCVRLCDGAQFPVSFATPRSGFAADGAACASACSSPARLFVGPPLAELSQMHDVDGKAYGDLPNAFRFTTTYDATCTCQGAPPRVVAMTRSPQPAMTTVAAPAHAAVEIAPASTRPSSPPQARIDVATTTASLAPVAEAGRPRGTVAAQPSVAGKPTVKVTTAARRVVRAKPTTIARAQQRQTSRVAHFSDGTGQRSFKSANYWRLSYWDASH